MPGGFTTANLKKGAEVSDKYAAKPVTDDFEDEEGNVELIDDDEFGDKDLEELVEEVVKSKFEKSTTVGKDKITS